MRHKNWRVIIVGFVLALLALGFYIFMMTMIPNSNDPVAMMQTVGTVAGGVIGISIAMIIVGLVGKKV